MLELKIDELQMPVLPQIDAMQLANYITWAFLDARFLQAWSFLEISPFSER